MKNEIYPCLWFDGNAKAAAEFYCTVFKDAKITSENPMVVLWEANGYRFMGLNGGPHFKFNEAVSFVVDCDDQQEIDYFWNALLADGGKESQCGWLKDKFGLSWQIVPTKVLSDIMSDREKGPRAMAKLMKMVKIEIAELENA